MPSYPGVGRECIRLRLNALGSFGDNKPKKLVQPISPEDWKIRIGFHEVRVFDEEEHRELSD